MAKMEFYSLEEVVAKLGIDEAAVKQMASRGELQPFRDRDKLLFKRDQVDILASNKDSMSDSIGLDPAGGGETGEISLADSGDTGAITLEDSGDTGIISLSDSASHETGAIPLADTGLGDTGEIILSSDDTDNLSLDNDGSTSIPLSDTGTATGADIGLSATGLGDSGIGLSATRMGDSGLSGTDLGGTALSADSGMDLHAAGSGIDLTGSLGGTDLPLSEPNDKSSEMSLSGSDIGVDLSEDNEGSSGLGLALDDLGGTASGDTNDSSAIGTGLGNAATKLGNDARQATGISVFDAGEVDEADPMAQTIITEAGIGADDDLALESVGSGSGLLDLTRESDDTSLGAELLDEIYPTGTAAGDTASGSQMDTAAGSSGVFDGGVTLEAEKTTASDDTAEDSVIATKDPSETTELQPPMPVAATAAPVAASAVAYEAFDPAGSGFATGMLLGATVSLTLVLTVCVSTLFGGTSAVVTMMAQDAGSLWKYVGMLGGISVIFGVSGLFVGKWLSK